MVEQLALIGVGLTPFQRTQRYFSGLVLHRQQSYTPDCKWSNRAEFINGRAEIEAFLLHKWQQELEYRLVKELWAFHQNRIAGRFADEWHDAVGDWFRSYGNENWEFDGKGLMRRRIACINDMRIQPAERKLFWPLEHLLDNHPGLSDLNF